MLGRQRTLQRAESLHRLWRQNGASGAAPLIPSELPGESAQAHANSAAAKREDFPAFTAPAKRHRSPERAEINLERAEISPEIKPRPAQISPGRGQTSPAARDGQSTPFA